MQYEREKPAAQRTSKEVEAIQGCTETKDTTSHKKWEFLMSDSYEDLSDLYI